MENEIKNVAKNTTMLYVMNIAKLVFPLITLPYLTRVLSVDCFAVVAYVKALMQYVTILLIFGFSLSATKDIVNAKNDKKKISEITSSVLEAKILLAIIASVFILIAAFVVPIIRGNVFYTILSFLNVIITEMMADFLFRGIDKMEVITIRFIIAKSISTLLTFFLVKNDNSMLIIPILDIIGSLAALILVLIEIKRLEVRLSFVDLSLALKKIEESVVYFFSDFATTAFGALNTLMIGLFLTKSDVSYWSLCLQLIAAVQSLYLPISNGIYPTMVRTKDVRLIKRILVNFTPIVLAGCIFCVVFSEFIVTTIGGEQYAGAAFLFKILVPVLMFSFPNIVIGWPFLGAIGKQKETTFTTIVAAVVQTLGLVVLAVFGKFSLISVALLRGMTELIMLVLRTGFCIKYSKELC